MSAQQELIERLRHHASSAPVISRQSIDMDAAADRLAYLSAENAALKAKLAGVDEKALEAGQAALHDCWDTNPEAPCQLYGREAEMLTRAAITAYLAAGGVE